MANTKNTNNICEITFRLNNAVLPLDILPHFICKFILPCTIVYLTQLNNYSSKFSMQTVKAKTSHCSKLWKLREKALFFFPVIKSVLWKRVIRKSRKLCKPVFNKVLQCRNPLVEYLNSQHDTRNQDKGMKSPLSSLPSSTLTLL